MTGLEKNARVFGIGLSKTGTSTLTEALKILGIRTLHYPNDDRTFEQLKSGDYRLSVLDRFEGLTDTPVAAFYAQLDTAWPGSRFILTLREKQSWLRSAELHWHVLKETGRMARDARFQAYTDFISACVYGCTYFNAERFSYVYDLHVRNVKDYFAGRPGDLLVLDVCGGQEWTELCEFLAKPVPRDVPFPHAYKRSWEEGARTRDELLGFVGNDRPIVVIDFEGLRELLSVSLKVRPLVQSEGLDFGLPQGDAQAIDELERHRTAEGAAFLAISGRSLWILARFPAFAEHVKRNYSVALSSERLVLFDLQPRQH